MLNVLVIHVGGTLILLVSGYSVETIGYSPLRSIGPPILKPYSI